MSYMRFELKLNRIVRVILSRFQMMLLFSKLDLKSYFAKISQENICFWVSSLFKLEACNFTKKEFTKP